MKGPSKYSGSIEHRLSESLAKFENENRNESCDAKHLLPLLQRFPSISHAGSSQFCIRNGWAIIGVLNYLEKTKGKHVFAIVPKVIEVLENFGQFQWFPSRDPPQLRNNFFIDFGRILNKVLLVLQGIGETEHISRLTLGVSGMLTVFETNEKIDFFGSLLEGIISSKIISNDWWPNLKSFCLDGIGKVVAGSEALDRMTMDPLYYGRLKILNHFLRSQFDYSNVTGTSLGTQSQSLFKQVHQMLLPADLDRRSNGHQEPKNDHTLSKGVLVWREALVFAILINYHENNKEGINFLFQEMNAILTEMKLESNLDLGIFKSTLSIIGFIPLLFPFLRSAVVDTITSVLWVYDDERILDVYRIALLNALTKCTMEEESFWFGHLIVPGNLLIPVAFSKQKRKQQQEQQQQQEQHHQQFQSHSDLHGEIQKTKIKPMANGKSHLCHDIKAARHFVESISPSLFADIKTHPDGSKMARRTILAISGIVCCINDESLAGFGVGFLLNGFKSLISNHSQSQVDAFSKSNTYSLAPDVLFSFNNNENLLGNATRSSLNKANILELGMEHIGIIASSFIPGRPFQDVIQFVTNMLLHKDHLVPVCSRVLMSIARMIDEQQMIFFLPRLLEMFQKKSLSILDIIAQKKDKAGSVAGNLGILLPVIAVAMTKVKDSSKYEIFNPLFCSLWVYNVLFAFVTERLWGDEWFQDTHYIAKNTPLLLDRQNSKEAIFTQIDTMAVTIEQTISLTEINELSSLLVFVMQKQEVMLQTKQLKLSQILYLLAVYYLELYRVEQGTMSLTYMFEYINDCNCGAFSDLQSQLFAITEAVFVRFLFAINALKETEKRERILEYNIIFLLLNINHSSTMIKSIAKDFLERIFQQERHHILANNTVLFAMFDLVQLLSSTNKRSTVRLFCHGKEFELHVTTNFSLRKQLAESYGDFCRKLLINTVGMSPNQKNAEIQTTLQNYVVMRSTGGSKSSLWHSGISLALQIINCLHASTLFSDGVCTPSLNVPSHKGSFFSILQIKTMFMGEVKGILLAEKKGENIRKGSYLNAMLNQLFRLGNHLPSGQFQRLINENKKKAKQQSFLLSKKSKSPVMKLNSNRRRSLQYNGKSSKTLSSKSVDDLNKELSFDNLADIVEDHEDDDGDDDDFSDGDDTNQGDHNSKFDRLLYRATALAIVIQDQERKLIDSSQPPSLKRKHIFHSNPTKMTRTNGKNTFKLIHDIVWFSVFGCSEQNLDETPENLFYFSPRRLETAVLCWSWLLCNDRYTLSSRHLWTSIIQAWESSVTRQLGLFNPQYNKTRINLGSSKAPENDRIEEMTCHDVWLSFFIQQFDLMKSSWIEVTSLLQSMLLFTFKHCKSISTHPKAFRARFKLLILALKVTQKMVHDDNQVSRNILQAHVYNTGLEWFQIEPQYWQCSDDQKTSDDIHILLEFMGLLKMEKNFVKKLNSVFDACEVIKEIVDVQHNSSPLAPPTTPGSLNTISIAFGNPSIPSLFAITQSNIRKQKDAKAKNNRNSATSKSDNMVESTNVDNIEKRNSHSKNANRSSSPPRSDSETEVFKSQLSKVVGNDTDTDPGSTEDISNYASLTKSSTLASKNESKSPSASRKTMHDITSSKKSNDQMHNDDSGRIYKSDTSILTVEKGKRSHSGSLTENTAKNIATFYLSKGKNQETDKTEALLTNYVQKSLTNYCKLLTILISNELERLHTWNNPQRIESLMIPAVDIAVDKRIIGDRKWEEYINFAFELNPKIAFQLPCRFPTIPCLKAFITNCIDDHPRSFSNIPKALPIWLKYSELQGYRKICTLLEWKASPPIQAFELMVTTLFPSVFHHAVKSLEASPPDTILFYIPQLIQLLRTDRYGYVNDYLVRAACKSHLLAHQMIWNLKANMYVDDEGLIHDEMKATFEKSEKRILQGLSLEGKSFYQREFSFFEKITRISGTLKPFSKAERRPLVLKELAKIEVQPGCYLPSNPTAIVTGIDYNSGIPLQSHAKAPFLATFRVQPSSIAEVESQGSAQITNSIIHTTKSETSRLSEPKILEFAVAQDPSLGDKSVVSTIISDSSISLAPSAGVVTFANNSSTQNQIAQNENARKSNPGTSPSKSFSDSLSPRPLKASHRSRSLSELTMAKNKNINSMLVVHEVKNELESKRENTTTNEEIQDSKKNDPKKFKKVTVNKNSESQEKFTSSKNDRWQSAIFKVGDDVRQDMLALQIISMFKTVFDAVGLKLFLFPYKVVATAPGCGVIECVPNAKTRDQLGRLAPLSLYEFFLSKYKDEKSIDFKKAQSNFVASMAAYSVVSYLLQFKDRHNANLMISDDGHIIHIDFGFMLNSAPGGKFSLEADIKLTQEMVQVMGGDQSAESFQTFVNLCVQAFLAIRPYQPEIISMVSLMQNASLDCFAKNPEKSLRNLLFRFHSDKNDREAADQMIYTIQRSYLSSGTVMYDRFQKVTNDIPY